MIDLTPYAGFKMGLPLPPPTQEALHANCLWCRKQPATRCTCYKDCGRPACAQGIEEFEMPEVPTFKENQ